MKRVGMLDDGTMLLAMTPADQRDCMEAAKLLAVIAALPVAGDVCARLAAPEPVTPTARLPKQAAVARKPGVKGTQAICAVCKKPFVRTTSQKTCGETCRKKRDLEQKLAFKRRSKLAAPRPATPAQTASAAASAGQPEKPSRLDLIRKLDAGVRARTDGSEG